MVRDEKVGPVSHCVKAKCPTATHYIFHIAWSAIYYCQVILPEFAEFPKFVTLNRLSFRL